MSAVGAISPEETARRAIEQQKYEQLKVEFQGWTLGVGLVGTVAAYTAYSQDTAISYALGASAGLTYLRLLSRSIDSGAWTEAK